MQLWYSNVKYNYPNVQDTHYTCYSCTLKWIPRLSYILGLLCQPLACGMPMIYISAIYFNLLDLADFIALGKTILKIVDCHTFLFEYLCEYMLYVYVYVYIYAFVNALIRIEEQKQIKT